MKAPALALLCALGAAGCIVHDEAAPAGPGEGALVVDWTIDGSKSGDACNANGVTSIQVTVFDTGGGTMGTFEQTCSAFSTSISLEPGTYTANAVLLDGSGRARTTTIAIHTFSIIDGTDLDTPIDFPSSSFE
jgi:hypothetical protein